MLIKRNDFLDVLKLVKPGIGEIDLSGLPKMVIFENGWVRSLNERLGISYKFETSIEGCLPFDQLYQALKLLKTNGVAIASNGERVVFECGFSELSLKLFRPEPYRIENNLDDVKWHPVPPSLLEGLKLSLLSAEDFEVGRLSGVVIANNLIVSSDNYRVSQYEMEQTISTDPIRLKTIAVKALLKMSKSFDLVGVSEEWLHLKNDSLIVSLKRMSATEYPLGDILTIFDHESTDSYELPAHLEQYIDRAALFAGIGVGELNFGVQIILRSEKGHLIVEGGKGLGKLSSKLPWDGYIPRIIISPETLKKLLGLTRSFKVVPTSTITMVLFELPNFKFLLQAKTGQVKEQAQKVEQPITSASFQQKLQALKQFITKKEGQ
jgi:hypothetical protein